MNWFVLNFHSPLSPRKGASAKDCIDNFNRRCGTNLSLFCPAFFEYRSINGVNKKIERPLTFHYTFVRGELDIIRKLCSENNNFSFVLNKSGENRYAIVDDSTMESFKNIARKFENNVPFYSLQGVNLEDFDLVEIVEGDFPGLIGYYSTQKGSNAGRIILRLTQNLATVVYDVKAKYVRILEFSKNFKRAYDIIDAFVPRLLKALSDFKNGLTLSENTLSDIHSFCRRMSACSLPNNKIDAKLQAILVAAYRLLGCDDEAGKAMDRFQKKKKSITAPATLALIHLLDYLVDNDPEDLSEARSYISQIPPGRSSASSNLIRQIISQPEQ